MAHEALYWSLHQYFLCSAFWFQWGIFGYGDILCVASSIWRWRVSESPIGCSVCPFYRAQNSDWSWNFLLIDETVLGLVVPISHFQKGASKFYCQQLSPSSNVFFVLKDHLKDVDSFIIFQVFIFHLNLI